ncbi:MAG: GAF domain-containing sensor histidine kinase [Ignavibacterium sp.]|nr:GAF domain-containing sensor histidine kinase [Ignavibacterium sp.]MCX7611551.1 GAF domain-containing sensor histidine kinase [Ignavibacterium sp.]MDW8374914.1 GAF domain-containing sensor histidine kinase [Ignavibacteriales bacterium]
MEKLKKLIEITIKLSSEKNVENLIGLIVATSTEFLNCERSTVFLYDKSSQELYSYSGIGINKKEIRFPISKGIAGYVASTGETLVIDDPYNNPLFNKEFDQITGFKTRNILTVPMRNIEGDIIGVFQILNKNDDKFTYEDIELSKAFASISAVAIENAHLIEELKRQYELLQKAFLELQQAQETIINQEKFATIGQLASGISHEIKNQLVVIMAVDFIRKLYPDDKKILKYTEYILEARNRILSLLDEIRDFSKSKEYEKSKIDLISLIDKTIKLERFDKDLNKINLEFKEPDYKYAFALVNQDKIQQVLINLIRNAAHASEPKSTIQLSLQEDENNWIISVKDEGCGIPEEIRDKIWQPFFTTKSSGTGLGLDICKKIIQNHNGEIYFESEVGKGTTFFIKLPKFL